MIKKIINITIIGLFLLSSFSMVSADLIKNEKNEDKLILNYSFENPIIEKIIIEGSDYSRITIKNSPSGGKSGEPRLPTKGSYILIPEGKKAKDVKIIVGEKKSLTIENKIEPVGKSVSLSSVNSALTPELDSKIYNEDKFFPGTFYSSVGTQYYNNYKILILKLFPIQYNPSTNVLIYYKDLKVEVELDEDKISNHVDFLNQDQNKLYNLLDNPKTIDTYNKNFLNKNPLSINSLGSYKYVIITTEDFKNYQGDNDFNSLCEYHTSKGLNAKIVSIQEIISNSDYWVNGKWGDNNNLNPYFKGETIENLEIYNDTEAKIRNFIRFVHYEWGTNYILFGGDHDIVPSRIVFLQDKEEYEWDNSWDFSPSDLYYSCLDGTWNSYTEKQGLINHSKRWGENNDGSSGEDVDLLAEVYVGRACVDTPEDLENFVFKTLKYVNTAPSEYYLKKLLLAGEFLLTMRLTPRYAGDALDQLVDMSNDDSYTTIGMPSNLYNIEKLYDREWEENGWLPPAFGKGGWPKEKIIEMINNEIHIINHLGHSNDEYNLKMYISDLNSLENENLFFIYSQGCIAGAFDYDNCIAEHFTVKTKNTAFAGIWNTRSGWLYCLDSWLDPTLETTDGASHRLNREFWDAIFNENENPPMEGRTLGWANQDSKEDNLYRISDNCMRWSMYGLHLFGDPAISFIKHEVTNSPPNKPTIEKTLIDGKQGYLANSADPDGDQIYYLFKWRDEEDSGWNGPFESGEDYFIEHQYISGIKVKAKDIHGTESDWSDPLIKNKTKINQNTYLLLQKLFEKFLILKELIKQY